MGTGNPKIYRTNSGIDYIHTKQVDPIEEATPAEIVVPQSTVHELQISNVGLRVKSLTIANVGPEGGDPIYPMLFDTDGDPDGADNGDIPSLPAPPLYPGGFIRLEGDIFENGLWIYQSTTQEELTKALEAAAKMQIRVEFYLT